MADQKKSVLGRGLGALIPRPALQEVSIREDVIHRDSGDVGIIASVDISAVERNPFQPRTDFDEKALAELTQSILEKGVIQPITVRHVAAGYQLVTGERRLRAAQAAKLRTIPAYIIDVKTDEEMLEFALIENIQREHLNPMEIANAYQRLMNECNLTAEDVAEKVGKDRSTVTNFVRLLKLPERIQEGIRKDKISMGHARALITIPNERVQLRIFERIVGEGWSVRKVEDVAKGVGKPTIRKHARTTHTVNLSSIRSVEEKVRQYLGTKVRVKSKGGAKGEITIEYYSLDDLDRLLDIFAAGHKHR
ncbi:MAG: ParB/RepB/Spo0J family partition protein [Ignavibacteriales bacterium]|nr:ParB/RepB/Spo0J family partition protein [Ignavibacteriales bacterium]